MTKAQILAEHEKIERQADELQRYGHLPGDASRVDARIRAALATGRLDSRYHDLAVHTHRRSPGDDLEGRARVAQGANKMRQHAMRASADAGVGWERSHEHQEADLREHEERMAERQQARERYRAQPVYSEWEARHMVGQRNKWARADRAHEAIVAEWNKHERLRRQFQEILQKKHRF